MTDGSNERLANRGITLLDPHNQVGPYRTYVREEISMILTKAELREKIEALERMAKEAENKGQWARQEHYCDRADKLQMQLWAMGG